MVCNNVWYNYKKTTYVTKNLLKGKYIGLVVKIMNMYFTS